MAPDYIGFGHSDAPSRDAVRLTRSTTSPPMSTGLVDALGLRSYILYMQDYGGPVGFRLFAAAAGPGERASSSRTPMPTWRVSATRRSRCCCRCGRTGRPQTEEGRARLRQPGRHQIPLACWREGSRGRHRPRQLGASTRRCSTGRACRTPRSICLENYKTNIALYPAWQAAFRRAPAENADRLGQERSFLCPSPAPSAYLNDLPDAKLVWLDSGHFVLDENADRVAAEIKAVFAG